MGNSRDSCSEVEISCAIPVHYDRFTICNGSDVLHIVCNTVHVFTLMISWTGIERIKARKAVFEICVIFSWGESSLFSYM